MYICQKNNTTEATYRQPSTVVYTLLLSGNDALTTALANREGVINNTIAKIKWNGIVPKIR